MLGSFLEISVHSPDVLASIQFYEKLGFAQVPTNDAWTHPYGVVTDGRCFIGIHAYSFPGPSLTFVAPELRRRVEELESAGADFEFLKLADDQFHELGFFAPDEQIVTLLEARTFSPPDPHSVSESLLGYFAEYRIPVEDRETALAQWLRFGLIENEPADAVHDSVSACCTGLNIGLTESRRVKRPTLVFHVANLREQLALLEQRGIIAHDVHEPRKPAEPLAATLLAPDSTPLLLIETNS